MFSYVFRIQFANFSAAPIWTVGKSARHRNQAPPFESDARSKFLKRRLVEVTAPLRELANEEFLRQAGAHPFRRAERKIAEYQAGTAIGLRVIEIGERGGCQVSA